MKINLGFESQIILCLRPKKYFFCLIVPHEPFSLVNKKFHVRETKATKNKQLGILFCFISLGFLMQRNATLM